MVCRGLACDDCTKTCEKLHQKPKELSSVVNRFFKIMFGDENYSKFLYLPPKFARTVQHLADQETEIEDACGLRWSVTLSKVKGSLAFQKGWPKFFLDHGLEQGEFLLFEYIKGSHFVVRIYDKSACERSNFNNEMPRQNKRARRDQKTASEGEPFQKADVDSGDKPASATSVASGSEFQTHQSNLAVKNADVGRMQLLPVSMNMEDLTCMINRDDEYYQGEDRNFLYDLSSFEMQNRALDPNKSQKVLNTKLDPARSQIGIAEQTKTMGDDAHSGEIFTDKIEKPLDTKLAPSHTAITEKTKTKGDDAEMALIQANQIKGHSGGIVTDKSEKALETKTVPSHPEITKQAIKKGDVAQMAAILPSQAAGHSGVTSKFFKKPSENTNLSKGMLDDVSNVQNESYSGSPSIGSSKIAEVVHVAKSRCHESSISSSVLKDPFDKHAIKKERVEMEDEANRFAQVSCGKEPTMVWNHGEMFSPAVKVEPDQSYDIDPSVDISPFSAEVKSKSYLELPTEFPKLRGRRDKGQGKIVYLKDSIGRIWPVFYPDKFGFKALTANWTRFCEANNIKPGDECRFQVENVTRCEFRVDVIRTFGESPHK